MIFGTCLSWCLNRLLGIRMSMFLMNLIWILGWYILSVSSDFITCLSGFIIVGFASGFNNNLAIDYLIEMPEPKLRGAVTVFSTVCSFIGVFLGHLLFAVNEDWRLTMQLCAIGPVLVIMFVYWSPESPYFLLKNSRPEKAAKNFFWLRGKTLESEAEFKEILSRQTNLENGQKIR